MKWAFFQERKFANYRNKTPSFSTAFVPLSVLPFRPDQSMLLHSFVMWPLRTIGGSPIKAGGLQPSQYFKEKTNIWIKFFYRDTYILWKNRHEITLNSKTHEELQALWITEKRESCGIPRRCALGQNKYGELWEWERHLGRWPSSMRCSPESVSKRTSCIWLPFLA